VLIPKTLAAVCTLGAVIACPAALAQERQLDVPYVPSPNNVVDAMLKLAEVKKTDKVIDLGCGDGRIVITAAQQFGSRGTGVDIDPDRIAEATANAKRAGVDKLVSFKQGNLFDADISEASVVTLYLLPDVNLKLRPKLLKDLKPGTRIVSHSFNMGDWKPEKEQTVEGRTIYMWRVPAAAR
jgi:SAM-dependent methyltransferase